MNFGQNIQADAMVRIAAVVAIISAFLTCLIIMAFDFIVHGSNFVLPSLVNTIISSVIVFAISALSSHQGAQIQQAGQATGASTVASTTVAAATALEKVNGQTNTSSEEKQALQQNTIATEANTQTMNRTGNNG